jgi:hypothetical protein
LPGEGTRFAIRIEGADQALVKVGEKRLAVLNAMHESLVRSSLKIRGTVISLIGQPGFPRFGTGRLSRAVRSFAERTSFGSRAVIGVESKVPYCRILELGGMQPARDIAPVRKRALRWVTGTSRLGMLAQLDFGSTRRQAFRSGKKFRKSDVFQRSDVHFFRPTSRKRSIHQNARYQRAIPYFGPGFEVERAGVSADLKMRLAAALKD